MTITLPNRKFYLPFIIIYISTLNPYISLLLAVTLFGFSLLKKGSSNFQFGLVIVPVIILLIWGGIFGFFLNHELWNITRDFFYFLIFLSTLYIGYYLYSLESNIKYLILSFSIIFIFKTLTNSLGAVSEIGNFGSVNELRDELGQSGTFTTALIFPFLGLLPLPVIWLLVASVAFSLLSFSRNNLLTLFFLLLASNIKYKILSIFLVVATIPIILSLINTPIFKDYTDKIFHSATEMFDTNIYDKGDAYANWRAYERLVVSEHRETLPTLEYLFGSGLGSTVISDFPKRTDATSTEYIYEIPTFHDSTLFVKVKFGVLGILLWLAWWLILSYFVIQGIQKIQEINQKKKLLLIFILYTIILISIFTYGYPLMRGAGIETVLLGFLLAKGIRTSQDN